MGHTEQLLVVIAAVVGLGIGGQWLAWKIRVPGVLVLLTLGCLTGGVLGWIKPDEVFGDMVQPLVSLAIGFILFEGGMTLKFSELRAVWRSVLGLLTVGVLVTWGLGTLSAYFLLGLPLSVSLVLAAVLTVTVMGVWLANQRRIDVHHILEFKETLTVLLISVLFIFLSARIDLAQIASLGWRGMAFAAAMIVLVRPTAVWLSTMGSQLAWKERAFLSWFAPRGIVAAAVSSVFALRMGEEGSLIAPATFIVIMSTVAIYGLSAGPLARYLGLAVVNPQGTLIAGANSVARAIATALKKEGFDTLLIDTRYDYSAKARDAGLRVRYANVLSDYVIDELDLGGIGRFLALTANDHVNTLAAARFRELFGTQNVFQLANTPVSSERFSPDASDRYSGRELFSESLTYSALETLLNSGAIIKSTKLSDEFSYADLKARVPDLRPLFLIQSGRIQVISEEKALSPKANQTVVYLTAGEAA